MVTPEPDSRGLKVKLYEKHGEMSRYVDAEIKDNGDLVVSGQDMGKAAVEIWGDSDYEFWLTVESANKDKVLKALVKHFFQIEVSTASPAQDKDKALLTLLERVYGGHAAAFQEFRSFLKVQGIPAKFANYA